MLVNDNLLEELMSTDLKEISLLGNGISRVVLKVKDIVYKVEFETLEEDERCKFAEFYYTRVRRIQNLYKECGNFSTSKIALYQNKLEVQVFKESRGSRVLPKIYERTTSYSVLKSEYAGETLCAIAGRTSVSDEAVAEVHKTLREFIPRGDIFLEPRTLARAIETLKISKESFRESIASLINFIRDYALEDIHSGNISINGNKEFKIIDTGMGPS